MLHVHFREEGGGGDLTLTVPAHSNCVYKGVLMNLMMGWHPVRGGSGVGEGESTNTRRCQAKKIKIYLGLACEPLKRRLM